MRHLHFTQSLEPLYGGGLGSSSTALHRELLTEGVESTLCATYGEARVNPAPRTWEFKRFGPHFLYYAPDLRRKLRELVGSSDVLHGHGFYVGTNYYFGSEARRQKKSLVYHVHGMFDPWILNRSSWKKLLVHRLFEDANFRHVRLWRALTPKEAEQIRGLGIETPIVVVPNGLEAAEFPRSIDTEAPIETPLAGNLKKDRLRLLFLGRLHPKKGLDVLLRAWVDLKSYHRHWQLVVAGPDERGYLAEVRTLARSLGVEDSVCFTGPVTGAAKNVLLRSADLFVLPSYSEGFSMSILEAMACEVPVLATRSCNFPQITEFGAGWECEPKKESLLATLSSCLAAGELERKQRGVNGCNLVRKHYNWKAIAQTLLEACAIHCS